MKIALVVCRVILNEHKEEFFGTPKELSTILQSRGFLPVNVGYESTTIQEIFEAVNPSVCLFTGGESLGENSARDKFELNLLSVIEKQQLPAIGICRGMQLMAHFMGVNTVIDKSHVSVRHEVIGNDRFEVNSYHENVLTETPKGFQSNYLSADGSIEAFSNPHKKWFGVMWHPEREIPDSPGYRHLQKLLESL
jgi:N5-(cytidine 5'-diphosphoramidyl)-L-glutamine hydrolase